ncbi:hypothetical protein RHMOL_Rhmol09G0111400 [Rhododendron molle]|uniref:Uncharacterized protein n=1 Tax=Rhododendron molle TaxID=49168 RepID=A0ACC0MD79_RHOML|nr:hypothetical protein RHMOL_Rhmol09G0111400 [Rhododendron molle]
MKKTLEFGRFRVYTITPANVGRALGLPLGTVPIPIECEEFHFKYIRDMFAEGDGELKRGVTFAMMQEVFKLGLIYFDKESMGMNVGSVGVPLIQP